jgi:GTPase SAR1 family protein
VIIIYNICSRSSFGSVSAIHQEIMEAKGRDKDFRICVVGNMIDETDWRQVSFEEGRELAERLKCAFEKCSSKDGANVEKIAFDIVRAVKRKRAKEKLRQEDKAE